ncbi:hypothetical protein H4219_000062 [Mycoemilia scoparia]|uniref:Uncharacterized protein n=1 Tax=Mycoemilia scoparia TaxID=417184 RepID=A0A9W8A3Q2_9FUNG|nr:hypothetical protein H4219_000062 [Mycoemilia scoparia]
MSVIGDTNKAAMTSIPRCCCGQKQEQANTSASTDMPNTANQLKSPTIQPENKLEKSVEPIQPIYVLPYKLESTSPPNEPFEANEICQPAEKPQKETSAPDIQHPDYESLIIWNSPSHPGTLEHIPSKLTTNNKTQRPTDPARMKDLDTMYSEKIVEIADAYGGLTNFQNPTKKEETIEASAVVIRKDQADVKVSKETTVPTINPRLIAWGLESHIGWGVEAVGTQEQGEALPSTFTNEDLSGMDIVTILPDTPSTAFTPLPEDMSDPREKANADNTNNNKSCSSFWHLGEDYKNIIQKENDEAKGVIICNNINNKTVTWYNIKCLWKNFLYIPLSNVPEIYAEMFGFSLWIVNKNTSEYNNKLHKLAKGIKPFTTKVHCLDKNGDKKTFLNINSKYNMLIRKRMQKVLYTKGAVDLRIVNYIAATISHQPFNALSPKMLEKLWFRAFGKDISELNIISANSQKEIETCTGSADGILRSTHSWLNVIAKSIITGNKYCGKSTDQKESPFIQLFNDPGLAKCIRHLNMYDIQSLIKALPMLCNGLLSSQDHILLCNQVNFLRKH